MFCHSELARLLLPISPALVGNGERARQFQASGRSTKMSEKIYPPERGSVSSTSE